MVIIREATKADLPQTLEILNDIIFNTTAIYDYDPHTLEKHNEWFETKQQQGFPVFVAEENDIVLGFSTIGPFRARQAYKFTVENSVHVKSDSRGRGISKLLMQPLIEAAKKLNFHAMVAVIDADNEISIGLHKKFGFEEVAHFKQVGYKFDRWLDLKFLELILLDMVTIREAARADLPQILEIYNEVILNTVAVYDYDPHTLEMRTKWLETKQQQGFPVFVAEEDNIILGFSTFGPFRPWQGFKYTVESSVYVKKDCRGKGVGKLLVQSLIEAAKKLGLHAIVTGIDADNKASIEMSKRLGFEEVAHMKQVGYKFNRWLDLKFLELVLDGGSRTPKIPLQNVKELKSRY